MTGKALLLSIKPRFAEALFSGRKTVELRRVKPRLKPGDLVLVYVTSPTCELQGGFRVERLLVAPPSQLWRVVGTACGISKEEFDAYFGKRKTAYGIVVKEKWILPTPVRLSGLKRRNIRPPQSYQYLAADQTRSRAKACQHFRTPFRQPCSLRC